MSTISEKPGPADPAKTKAQLLAELNELRQRVARLETAEPLNQSEERYGSVITAMAEGVVMQQRGGEIVACNPAAEQILGLTREQMMGRTSLDPRWRAIHADGTPFPGETHPGMVTLRTGQPQRDVIMGVHKPDGRLTWILINSEPMVQPGAGEPYAVVVTFTDITAQRQAEELLRQSERKFRQVVEQSNDAIILYDESGRLVEMNPAAERLSGLERDKALGQMIWDLQFGATLAEWRTPAVYEQLQTEWLAYFQTGQHPTLNRVIELDMQRPDGTRRMVQAVRFPIKTERGYLLGVVVRDVTERKQAEIALRESEARFKAVFDCAGVGITLIDPNGPRLQGNPALQQILGYSAEELSEITNLSITHPDDRALTQAWMADLLGGRLDSTRIEKRYLHKNGQTVWVDLSITPIRVGQDQPVAFIGAVVDITARKEAEAALRASEEKIRQIIEKSGDGIMLADETGRLVEWNPRMEQITGLARAEALGQVGWQVRFELLPTEHRTQTMYEQIKAKAQAYFQTGQDPQLNQINHLEIERRDRSYRDLQEMPFSIQSQAGFWRGNIIRHWFS